jgi:basic membrane lipoprotein Med (substrate-binding protein (PBP1-ABC) superfamily)
MMWMKIFTCLMICLVMLFGCSKSSIKTPEFKYPFSVLLLVPGSITDQNTNQRAYEAMQKIGSELKVNVLCKEIANPRQVSDVLSETMNKKIDFVIGLGGQMISPLTQAALTYPETKFAVVGRYAGNFRNFGSLSYLPSYFYLAGTVAAIKSKTGKIGALVSDNTPETKEQINAFLLGAKRINPNIELFDINIDSADNYALALKCTEAYVKQNVDVIYINCGEAGLPIHKWAQDNHIYTIGYLDDQYPKAPKAVLTSVIVDLHHLLSNSIEMVMIGKWQGRAYRYGMTDNITSLALLRGVLNPGQEIVFENIYRELTEQRGEFKGMVN